MSLWGRLRQNEPSAVALRKRANENIQLSAELMKSVRTGNPGKVDEALLHIHSTRLINKPDRAGLTALHYAAKLNKSDIVSKLIKRGADIHMKTDDTDKFTPFHFICRWRPQNTDGSTVALDNNTAAACIKLLFQAGLDCNICDNYGMTGLHHACQRGNLSTVQELMKWKELQTKIDISDNQGQTALHFAANRGDDAIVKLLLHTGASPHTKDDLGAEPLHLAVREGHIGAARTIVKHVSQHDAQKAKGLIGALNANGSTILHLAVENGQLESVRFAIKNKVKPNAVQSNGDTALHLAATKGHFEIVKFLVRERGSPVDLNARDVNGETPLHEAARLNREAVLVHLIERGADVDAQNWDGLTPLMKAAQWGQSKAVVALLDRGRADITIRDVEERTALWHAVKGNNLEVVKLIASCTRDQKASKHVLNASDQEGNNILHVAARSGFLDMARWLTEDRESRANTLVFKNYDERTPLHLAAVSGHPSLVRHLVTHGEALIEDEDDRGNKPLHLAAKEGHSNVVKVLLELGAAVAARNSKRWTPLDCAANEGNYTCCEVLLKHGAPIDALDKKGRTPLHVASRGGHTKVVQLLLDNNADIARCDKTGRNCLDLAVDHDRTEAANAIVSHNRWRSALRNVSRGRNDPKGNRYQNTPMLKLIRKMPDVAANVLRRCMDEKQGVSVESESYTVRMDFEFIDYVQPHTAETEEIDGNVDDDEDGEDNDSSYRSEQWFDWNPDRNHNHPLLVMVESNQEDLLSHPVVTTLLDYKWKTFSRYFYYMHLLMYSIYLGCLTVFAMTAVPEITGFVEDRTHPVIKDDCTTRKQNVLLLCGSVVCVYCYFRALHEISALHTKGTQYFSVQSFLEWTLLVTSVVFVCDWEVGQPCVITNWQWQIGVVAVWCAWLSFIALQRRSALLGIYIVMFTHVMSTFLKLLMVIILFVIAFGLAFYMLLENLTGVRAYSTPWRALLKTAVSMAGEFDFDTIFNNDDGDLPFPAVSCIIWISFLVIMPIILMNMLVGLAVDDIKGVQDSARLKRLGMQVRLILGIESATPFFLQKRFGLNISHYDVLPNEPTTLWARMKKYLLEDYSMTEKIHEAINPGRGELDKLEEQNKEIRYQLRDLAMDVRRTQDEMTDNHKTLCRHYSVASLDEDAK